MASFDLTLLESLNLDTARTQSIDFVSGHSVGDIIEADGTVSGAVGDTIMGVVIRAGSASAKTLVLIEGPFACASAHGLAAGAKIYSDGDNTASDAEPAGAAGTRITELGHCYSTTTGYLKVTSYEKGA